MRNPKGGVVWGEIKSHDFFQPVIRKSDESHEFFTLVTKMGLR